MLQILLAVALDEVEAGVVLEHVPRVVVALVEAELPDRVELAQEEVR